ncbi:unnamed protein product [Gongylonema pulchrum]|uniref:DUF1758 domain-containing protein n=1 Tax=Gongylonema pulchrum TaxID=637853 RepID=A0A183EFH3_9BILA|nr:unnamed protein product [Gongylonema pulchrum]
MQYHLSTFGSLTKEFETGLVEFDIQLDGGELKPVTAHTVKEILPPLHAIRMDYSPDMNERDSAARNYVCALAHPDIRIGIDYLWDFLLPQQTHQLPNGFTIAEPTVGPLVCGRGDLRLTDRDRSGNSE